jgi:hypothetical protein
VTGGILGLKEIMKSLEMTRVNVRGFSALTAAARRVYVYSHGSVAKFNVNSLSPFILFSVANSLSVKKVSKTIIVVDDLVIVGIIQA